MSYLNAMESVSSENKYLVSLGVLPLLHLALGCCFVAFWAKLIILMGPVLPTNITPMALFPSILLMQDGKV